MYHAIFIGTYLFLFFAIITRMNKGLEGSLSINVRGIMTVVAVLFIGWPVLLMQQATVGTFSQWHHAFPMLWIAIALPMVLGTGMVFFEVFQKAGKALSKLNFTWPLLAHFTLTAGFFAFSRLENKTDPTFDWIFFSGLHIALGIIFSWLSIRINNTNIVIIQWCHTIGLLVSSTSIGIILYSVPRSISTNLGLSSLDLAMAKIPFIWFVGMLLPLVWVLHLWGLVHIRHENISKTV